MSDWQDVPADGKIASSTSCVIVRKRNRRDSWNVSIAYLDVSGVWRLDRAGWPSIVQEDFTQWHEIPL